MVLRFRAKFLYQVEIKKQLVRMGISYWQQGNSNEFDDSAKQLVGKNSYFQLGRSIFANLTMMY